MTLEPSGHPASMIRPWLAVLIAIAVILVILMLLGHPVRIH